MNININLKNNESFFAKVNTKDAFNILQAEAEGLKVEDILNQLIDTLDN